MCHKSAPRSICTTKNKERTKTGDTPQNGSHSDFCPRPWQRAPFGRSLPTSHHLRAGLSYLGSTRADAPTLLKILKSGGPDIWIRLPKQKWPKSWSSIDDPVVLHERNLYGHHLAGLLWERQFAKVLLEHGWEKF